MNDKKGRKLKSGFTTGTAAAAAAKAALVYLLTNKAPEEVDIGLLTEPEQRLRIPIQEVYRNGAKTAGTVKKDAGDDPDVTNRAIIGANVRLTLWVNGKNRILIKGGHGVGHVTKPGLEVLPGHAAINPGPLTMIRKSVEEAARQLDNRAGVEVEIFVPKGEELARKTLNERLGIIGGISILGTTGIVKPLSHEAYIATIRSSLSVCKALGLKEVVFTTGRRSERFAQKLFSGYKPEAFIQMGDNFKESLDMAAEFGIKSVILAVFFGKAVKIAMGYHNTHAKNARLDMERLARWSRECVKDAKVAAEIAEARTARQVLNLVKEDHPEMIEDIGQRMVSAAKEAAHPDLNLKTVIFDFDGNSIFTEGIA